MANNDEPTGVTQDERMGLTPSGGTTIAPEATPEVTPEPAVDFEAQETIEPIPTGTEQAAIALAQATKGGPQISEPAPTVQPTAQPTEQVYTTQEVASSQPTEDTDGGTDRPPEPGLPGVLPPTTGPGPDIIPDTGEPELPPTITDVINPATGQPYDLSTAEGRTAATLAVMAASLNDPQAYLRAQGAEQKYTEHEINEIMEISDPLQFAIPSTSLGNPAQGTVTQAQAAQAQAFLATASEDVRVQDFEVSLVNPEDLQRSFDELRNVDPMAAASMSDEMTTLLAGMEEGNIPMWARPAVAKVEQALSARGLSASSIGRDSLFNAIIQSAMPIAQANATFKQDASRVNYQARVNAIMSDTAAHNAALQFNASSINQKNQFMSQLQAQVDMQNASRRDSMAQFNAAALTDISKSNASMYTQVSLANAQMETQMSQFNASQLNEFTKYAAQLEQQRAQFNSQMAAQIEQSNVQWRRQVNAQNTAGINAVNQANAQNAFNLSNQAMAFMWQEMRDQADWEFKANERELDRQHELEVAWIAREYEQAEGSGGGIADIVNGLQMLRGLLGD